MMPSTIHACPTCHVGLQKQQEAIIQEGRTPREDYVDIDVSGRLHCDVCGRQRDPIYIWKENVPPKYRNVDDVWDG